MPHRGTSRTRKCTPQDPAVGLCLGFWKGPKKVVGVFLWARYSFTAGSQWLLATSERPTGHSTVILHIARKTLACRGESITAIPRSHEKPTPLGSSYMWATRHRATVGSYERGVVFERGTPVQEPAPAQKPLVGLSTGPWARLYRGASLIRNRSPLRPCSRPMPRVVWWP